MREPSCGAAAAVSSPSSSLTNAPTATITGTGCASSGPAEARESKFFRAPPGLVARALAPRAALAWRR